jgi:hypothetical protein
LFLVFLDILCPFSYIHEVIYEKSLFEANNMSLEGKIINMVMKPKNITGQEAMIILIALMIIVLNMGILAD